MTDSVSDSQTPPQAQPPLRTVISWLAWPSLLAICIAITGYGFTVDHPALFFNIAYTVLAVSLYALEQIMPHEQFGTRMTARPSPISRIR